jgi:hypothetical protein
MPVKLPRLWREAKLPKGLRSLTKLGKSPHLGLIQTLRIGRDDEDEVVYWRGHDDWLVLDRAIKARLTGLKSLS